MNRYPEIRPAGIRAALATRYGCSPEQLIVTRGTSEAIDLLIRVFCNAGSDSVVTPTPSFSMYRHYAVIQGAVLREVESLRDEDFRVDPARILAACDESTKLVFLCSPNNPTGTLLPERALRQVLDDRAGKSAVVVDEAYIEFSSEPSAIPLLQQYDNLIVLRTLSKALAYAGARCGSVIAHPDVANIMDAVQAPYAFATPVVECVEDALQEENLGEAERWVEEVVHERQRLVENLVEMPCVRRIWPSEANFFLVQVHDAPALMRQTGDDKVLLRYFGGELSDCVRITVGTRDENDQLLRTIAKVGQ